MIRVTKTPALIQCIGSIALMIYEWARTCECQSPTTATGCDLGGWCFFYFGAVICTMFITYYFLLMDGGNHEPKESDHHVSEVRDPGGDHCG